MSIKKEFEKLDAVVKQECANVRRFVTQKKWADAEIAAMHARTAMGKVGDWLEKLQKDGRV